MKETISTEEQELIQKLTQSISNLAVNPVPLDKRLWNSDDCSQYLRMSKKTFQSYYAPHPKFPRSIKLEREGGRSTPLWKASEVVEWAIKHK